MTTLSKQIDIAIVDEHPITLHGLKEICKNINFINKVVMCSSESDLIRASRTRDFDLIVINTVHAVRMVQVVRNLLPNAKILMLNLYKSLEEIIEMYSMGVHGYITQNAGIDDLKSALHTIIKGDKYYCKSLNADLINLIIQRDKSNSEFRSITHRETEVLKLICEQYSSDEIASKLFLSPKTVKRHRQILFKKIGVKNVAGLVIYAIKNKIYSII